MARPAGAFGEVHCAVVQALRQQPCTLNEVVERAGISYGAAKATLQNAKRAGDVTVTCHRSVPHSKRPVAVYECSDVLDDLPTAGDWRAVSDALAGWSR